ncbi:MAG: hypothetical protein AB8I08_38180 [Sandaracinaceae bacterium]
MPPPAPKSDLPLYIGLGVVVLLILVVSVGVIIGIAGGFSDDPEGDTTEQVED